MSVHSANLLSLERLPLGSVRSPGHEPAAMFPQLGTGNLARPICLHQRRDMSPENNAQRFRTAHTAQSVQNNTRCVAAGCFWSCWGVRWKPVFSSIIAGVRDCGLAERQHLLWAVSSAVTLMCQFANIALSLKTGHQPARCYNGSDDVTFRMKGKHWLTDKQTHSISL